jgi:ATP-dependent Clp protease ATP-binding subunit ClpA
MNLNNFTLKAQESVQQAFNIAKAKGQQAVECAHIIKGIMSEAVSREDNIVIDIKGDRLSFEKL